MRQNERKVALLYDCFTTAVSSVSTPAWLPGPNEPGHWRCLVRIPLSRGANRFTRSWLQLKLDRHTLQVLCEARLHLTLAANSVVVKESSESRYIKWKGFSSPFA